MIFPKLCEFLHSFAFIKILFFLQLSVYLITRKICGMEYCEKYISETFNVTLKKIEKIHMDCQKLINLFEMKKG